MRIQIRTSSFHLVEQSSFVHLFPLVRKRDRKSTVHTVNHPFQREIFRKIKYLLLPYTVVLRRMVTHRGLLNHPDSRVSVTDDSSVFLSVCVIPIGLPFRV